ncbi:MAG: hypothetical protein IPM37_16925 [Hahellaceae bacterium]|nr:hypothetical protein [Hahellaceae bacterium]
MKISEREAILQTLFDIAQELALACEIPSLTMHEAFSEEWLEDLGDYAESELFVTDGDGNTAFFRLDWDNGVWFLTSEDGSQQYGRPSYLDSPGIGHQFGALLSALFDQ